jgi:hypothetical protein
LISKLNFGRMFQPPRFGRTRPKIPFFCPAPDTSGVSLAGIGGRHFGEIFMTITSTGRSARILAAGLFLCVAGPMRVTIGHAQEADAPAAAAESAAPSKPIELKKFTKPHHARVAAKAQKSAKVAAKAAAAKAEAEPARDAEIAPAMPDSVANANAELPADTSSETPQTVSARADNLFNAIGGTPAATVATPAAAAADVVAEDQLNELDRAATDDKPVLTLASATLDAPVVVSNDDSTALDKTSLIGKIFIACGGLLTLASAARMFIA